MEFGTMSKLTSGSWVLCSRSIAENLKENHGLD
jgi:hypothetical protein